MKVQLNINSRSTQLTTQIAQTLNLLSDLLAAALRDADFLLLKGKKNTNLSYT